MANTEETIARKLLSDHPLDRERIWAGDPRDVHLILIGFNSLGKNIALQAAKIGHFANDRRLHIAIAGDGADAEFASFSRQFPHFPQVCDVALVPGAVLAPSNVHQVAAIAAAGQRLTTVVVCLEDAAPSRRLALALRDALGGTAVPILVRLVDPAELNHSALLLNREANTAAAGPVIIPFGPARSAAQMSATVEALDLLAKAVHEDYRQRRLAAGKDPSVPELQPWDTLDPVLKDSNRQQIDHLPVKLRAAGFAAARASESPGPADGFTDAAAGTDNEVEVLARMEHSRWNAEKLLAGWSWGETKDLARRLNPSILPWDQLPDHIKEYDREAVRNIPSLLALTGKVLRRRPA